MDIMVWLYVFVLTAYLFGGILFLVVSFIYRIKCNYVKKCLDRQCKFRKYCDKYYEALTQGEVESLIAMLDSLGL